MGLFLGPLNIFLVGLVYWLLFLGQRWWGAHGADPSILDGGLFHLSSGSTPALFGSENYPSANPVFEESPVYGRFLRAPPVGIVAKITAAAATVAILFLLLRCFTSLKRYAAWEANRRLAQGGSPCQVCCLLTKHLRRIQTVKDTLSPLDSSSNTLASSLLRTCLSRILWKAVMEPRDKVVISQVNRLVDQKHSSAVEVEYSRMEPH